MVRNDASCQGGKPLTYLGISPSYKDVLTNAACSQILAALVLHAAPEASAMLINALNGS